MKTFNELLRELEEKDAEIAQLKACQNHEIEKLIAGFSNSYRVETHNQSIIAQGIKAMITNLTHANATAKLAVETMEAQKQSIATLKSQVTDLQNQLAAGNAISDADLDTALKPIDDEIASINPPPADSTVAGTGTDSTGGAAQPA